MLIHASIQVWFSDPELSLSVLKDTASRHLPLTLYGSFMRAFFPFSEIFQIDRSQGSVGRIFTRDSE